MSGGRGPPPQANQELKRAFPNLIFEEHEAEGRGLDRPRRGVCLDIETHGTARRKEEFRRRPSLT